MQRQVTFAAQNHLLTNTNVWSHDGQWIVYDVRSDVAGSVFDGTRIERVHVETGHVEVLFTARHGAHVGVATCCPIDDRIAFIAGPENPTDDWQYGPFHRQGIIGTPGHYQNLDARDIVSPFTPGALRGGSHVHVFSPDGQCVSYTYEDHVLATNRRSHSQKNQRNVGVSVLGHQVIVPKTHPRNHDGQSLSVVVTTTSDSPRPGSDDIDRAYEDAWIGDDGYVRDDGSRQRRSLAFIGDCIAANGRRLSELFIVDLPDDCTQSGNGPLCGTETTRPCPPRGTVQRRLTHGEGRRWQGLSSIRHWPRSSPDGSKIAFLMRDDLGVTQLWTISPNGHSLMQWTHGDAPVTSAFSFRRDGKAIACVVGKQVGEVDTTGGDAGVRPVTPPTSDLRGEACVYSPDGRHVAYVRTVPTGGRSLNQIFVAPTSLAED